VKYLRLHLEASYHQETKTDRYTTQGNQLVTRKDISPLSRQ